MPGLARLHAAMQHVGIERMRFRIPHNHLTFEGVFLADVVPYELALACLGHDFALFFEVSRTYDIKAYLGDAYGPLAAALGTGAGSGNPLKSSDFLGEIDAALPQRASLRDRATHTDVVRIYRDVEEADKVHLCGWRDNTAYGTHVTGANLGKTRHLLGQVAHDFCQRHNLSTRWTDDPARATADTLPNAPIPR